MTNPCFRAPLSTASSATHRTMKPHPSLLAGLALAVLAITSGTYRSLAQANGNPPERLTYQGFLVDGNGVALGNTAPKNYDVIFRIYNHESASASDNLLWGEQQTVTVDKGYFSVLLGEGAVVTGVARPDLSTLFRGPDASDRFVGITVKGIGAGANPDVDILPRLRLLSSPYAFLAQNAVKLVQDTGADLITSSGNAVTVNGPVTANRFSGNGANLSSLNADNLGSGTLSDNRLSGNVALRSGGNTFSGSQILNNGRLGLGIDSPEARLHATTASGQSVAGIFESGSSAGTWLALDNTSAGGVAWQFNSSGSQDAAGAGKLHLGHGAAPGDMTVRMTLDKSGNVGIGTSSVNSNARLQLYGGALMPSPGDKESEGIEFPPDAFGGSGDRAWIKLTREGSSGEDTRLEIGTANDGEDHIVLIPSGNVGVGVLQPRTKLHVTGGNGAQLRLQSSVNSHYWNLYTESSPNTGHMLFVSSASTGAFISRNNGTVGNISDRNVKKDIQPMTGVLDRVLRLRPVTFRYTNAPNDAPLTHGFVAQDVAPLFPDLVTAVAGRLALSVTEFSSLAIAALQEMHRAVEARFERQEREVTELKRFAAAQEDKINAQHQELEALRTRLASIEKLFQESVAASRGPAVIPARLVARSGDEPAR